MEIEQEFETFEGLNWYYATELCRVGLIGMKNQTVNGMLWIL
jgi:hypothetical protein